MSNGRQNRKTYTNEGAKIEEKQRHAKNRSLKLENEKEKYKSRERMDKENEQNNGERTEKRNHERRDGRFEKAPDEQYGGDVKKLADDKGSIKTTTKRSRHNRKKSYWSEKVLLKVTNEISEECI